MPSFAFSLESVPPFRLDLTAWALRRLPVNRIDRIERGVYSRVIMVRDNPIGIFLSQPAGEARMEVYVRGARRTKTVQSHVAATVEKMLGTRIDLSQFYAVAKPDPLLGPLAGRFLGLKPPRFPTVFEGIVNGIACQQLSLNVGLTLLNRLSEACAPFVGDQTGEQRYAFPRPQDLLKLSISDLRGMGFSTKKGEFLLGIARDIDTSRLDLETLSTLDRKKAIESLTNIRGVGRWTAEYALLRGIGDLSAFPGDDVGGRNKLQRWLGMKERLSYEAVRKITSKWAPFPGFIYFHLLLQDLARKGQIVP